MPGAKQAWPTVAACWSPATPRIGDRRRRRAPGTRRRRTRPRSRAPRAAWRAGRGAGAAARRPSRRDGCRRAACARRWWRRWRGRAPPVSRQSRKLSTVPKASSPRSARARAPGTLSRIQAILVAEKYGIERAGPVRAVISGFVALAPSAGRRARRCGGPARRWRGGSALPVRRSHTSVVSRWLVMPIAAMSRRRRAGLARAPRGRPRPCVDQRSSGSCSTQPGRREMLREFLLRRPPRSRCPRETGWRATRSCPGRSRE